MPHRTVTANSSLRMLVIILAAFALVLTPVLERPAYAADCFGSEKSHPDCFHVFVDRHDRQSTYWGSGSYQGSMTGFVLEIRLEGENGELLDYDATACVGTCRVGTDEFSAGGHDSFCARLIATIGKGTVNAITVYDSTRCRVV